MSRTFARSQGLIRSFFGLGPDQMQSEDFVLPTFDIEHLGSPTDQQLIQAQTAGIAPGADGAVTLQLPSIAPFLLDWAGFYTTGPATSGTTIINGSLDLIRAGVNLSLPLFGAPATIQKSATPQGIGFRFRPPFLMVRQPAPSNGDRIVGIINNPAGSVGNAVLVCVALIRPLEAARETLGS